MKEPAYKGKEPLPLSVYVSARAGDPQAVERLLRYYDNYMNCLCTRTLYDEDGYPHLTDTFCLCRAVRQVRHEAFP